MSNIKFSIIIPAYNAEPYIHELLECLNKQMTDETEVILIDDGSDKPLKLKKNYPWISHFSRHKNKGISYTRNKGLELAKGELINFLDADDMVSDNFISYILGRIDEEWDYMDLSWKSLEDDHFWFKLNSDSDSLTNPSASTRVFRRSFIGDTRFPEKKDASEDEHFTRHLDIKHAKHICATDFMYFYRTEVPNSNSKKFLNAEKKTKRIGYYFKTVTKDMTYLIDEFKKEDETNEVFLLTYKNEIPELSRYCQIWSPPKGLRVMEARGEATNLFNVIPKPIKTQVVLYRSQIDVIGGIETFIYSFCKKMSKYYDICVVYDTISNEQMARLIEIVPVVKNNLDAPIICDTLIINSIGETIPRNVTFKKSVQMVHCLKQGTWHIPQDRDYIVNVSQASKDSFGEQAKNGIVIHNLSVSAPVQKSLLLVSAIRVGASDKMGNDERCVKFAQLLKKAEIPFMWIYFGNRAMRNAPQEMIYGGLVNDIRPYVAKADYLVQLSGAEAFSYSLLESLECHTPVIVTPLAQNADMGIVDGLNSYVVPFDVDGFDVKKILQIPEFEYLHDNEGIVAEWRGILGNTRPKGGYKPKKEVEVIVTKEYKDLQRGELMKIGTHFITKLVRAYELQGLGFVKIID